MQTQCLNMHFFPVYITQNVPNCLTISN